VKAFTRNIALQVIANERLGFSFGKPERVDEKLLSVVLPILRKTSHSRQYITLMETKEVVISDTGSINRMKFSNHSKENVFVRSGTILKGSTQERATTRSAVLYPGKEVELDVRCVHQTKGISLGARVQSDALTPLAFDQAVYNDGYRPSDQHQYWKSATMCATSFLAQERSWSDEEPVVTASMGDVKHVRSPLRASVAAGIRSRSLGALNLNVHQHRQDDLSSNFAAFSKTFEEVLAKVKLHKDQVGLGFLTDQGVQTVELFDVPMSWKALHKDAVKRLGPDLTKLDQTGVFEYKADKAVASVRDVLSAGFEQNEIYSHKPTNGELGVEITGLTNEKFVGEVVEVDGRVVHLVLLRREKN
jgi:hypothetical protein